VGRRKWLALYRNAFSARVQATLENALNPHLRLFTATERPELAFVNRLIDEPDLRSCWDTPPAYRWRFKPPK
jgi:hypothetical protein